MAGGTSIHYLEQRLAAKEEAVKGNIGSRP